MTPLEKAALEWYDKRQAFLDVENAPRDLLNACSDGEHNLAKAVREYRNTDNNLDLTTNQGD